MNSLFLLISNIIKFIILITLNFFIAIIYFFLKTEIKTDNIIIEEKKYKLKIDFSNDIYNLTYFIKLLFNFNNYIKSYLIFIKYSNLIILFIEKKILIFSNFILNNYNYIINFINKKKLIENIKNKKLYSYKSELINIRFENSLKFCYLNNRFKPYLFKKLIIE